MPKALEDKVVDYRKLATLAREWAEDCGFAAAHIVRYDPASGLRVGEFKIVTDDGELVTFARWQAGRFPPMQRFSVIAGDNWEKDSEGTAPEMFKEAASEFSFLAKGGLTLKPGQVSEVVLQGEGPELDRAGRCLLDELELAFQGMITVEDDEIDGEDDEE